ncbi:MAG: hypothetical protein LW700_13615 [Gemmataceae bacterium]|nr:hypothetical protein [Gemmataceae bacterium]
MLPLLGLLALGQSLILDPPWQSTERAPHRKGNLYAPELVREQGRFFLYYGAQGVDGHDRIHLALSTDGITWKRHAGPRRVEGCDRAGHLQGRNPL